MGITSLSSREQFLFFPLHPPFVCPYFFVFFFFSFFFFLVFVILVVVLVFVGWLVVFCFFFLGFFVYYPSFYVPTSFPPPPRTAVVCPFWGHQLTRFLNPVRIPFSPAPLQLFYLRVHGLSRFSLCESFSLFVCWTF